MQGYYESPETLECLPCTYPCATCNNGSTCLTCINDINRSNLNPCECDPGFYDTLPDSDNTDNC